MVADYALRVGNSWFWNDNRFHVFREASLGSYSVDVSFSHTGLTVLAAVHFRANGVSFRRYELLTYAGLQDGEHIYIPPTERAQATQLADAVLKDFVLQFPRDARFLRHPIMDKVLDASYYDQEQELQYAETAQRLDSLVEGALTIFCREEAENAFTRFFDDSDLLEDF